MEHITLLVARAKAGLSVAELEALSGVSKATISRLETGAITNPKLGTVIALERALGLVRGLLVFRAPTEVEERRARADRRLGDRRRLLQRRASANERRTLARRRAA